MPETQPNLAILQARLSDVPIGLPAFAVRTIVRAAEITPLAGAPRIIEGTVNLHGTAVPVVDLRYRFGMPAVPLAPDQVFIVLDTLARTIVVRVDDVDDVIEISRTDLGAPDALSPVLRGLVGVAPLESGALVIYDVDAFLTQAEREALDHVSPVAL